MFGILPLWKPAGFTSHDCVMKTRKILKTKKVGHTGTLDPEVTGVLPLAIGRATKAVQYIQDLGKSYDAVVTVGISTTTEDQTGDAVEQKTVNEPIPIETIKDVLRDLTGEIIQTPPMYSAVKVNGKRLYEYAREGIEVERPSRKVTIYHLELTGDPKMNGDTLSFPISVSCSKGTYIRTLAVAIGEKLGYPAHMSHLIRTASAGILSEDCITFAEMEELMEKGGLAEKLMPLEQILDELPKYEIHDTLAEKIKNGAVLPTPETLVHISDDQPISIIHNGKILAIYKKHPTKDGLIKPDKVLMVN